MYLSPHCSIKMHLVPHPAPRRHLCSVYAWQMDPPLSLGSYRDTIGVKSGIYCLLGLGPWQQIGTWVLAPSVPSMLVVVYPSAPSPPLPMPLELHLVICQNVLTLLRIFFLLFLPKKYICKNQRILLLLWSGLFWRRVLQGNDESPSCWRKKLRAELKFVNWRF